jgi:hypothetical protein
MIAFRIAVCTFLCVTSWGATTRAQVAQVWGIQPATNQIVRVDPTTGMVFGGFTPPGGALTSDQLFGGLTMAEHGGTLLYQNPVANPTNLYRIDPQSGALLSTESMPAAGSPDFRAGLSFESGAGPGGADAIFAINDGAPVQRQDGYSSPTLVDHVQTAPMFAGALGGDDQGRHFVAIGNAIAEFDPGAPGGPINTLGLATPIGEVGGLAFDGAHVYLATIIGQLLTIDPDTGGILHTVDVQGGFLSGLAAGTPIPEPASWAMVVLAGFAITRVAARRNIRRRGLRHA